MSKHSGGQLAPTPNRKSGSKPHKGTFGSLVEKTSKGRPSSARNGQTHITKGGPARGGSGSARKGKR